MDRPNWYDDERELGPRSRVHIPPLRAWTANSLLLLTLAVMLLAQLVYKSATGSSLIDVFALQVGHLANPLRWYEFVTYALMHSESDLLHLGFNALMLYFFGRDVEAVLGGRRPYLLFCAAAAATAGLAFVLESLVSPGAVTVYGASGVCFAVLVAFAAHNPQRELMLIFPPVAVKAWALAAIVMAIALFQLLMARPGDPVSHIAHLGGGVFGYLFIRYRASFAGWVAGMRARQAQQDRLRAVERREEIDRILDKINEQGIGSLTRAERRFLDSASRDYRDRK